MASDKNDAAAPKSSETACVVQKCQRSSQATGRPNQLRRTAVPFGVIFEDSTWIISLGFFEPVCWPKLILNQRYQPPLCVAIAVDVTLSGLNGAMTGKQLNIAQ